MRLKQWRIFADLLAAAALCLICAAPVGADQQTTVLSERTKLKNAVCELPYIDGSNNETLEKQANNLLRETARSLVEKVGGAGSLGYRVTLNRPSLISILLEAHNGGRTAYKGLNLDLTSGREFGIGEFFMNSSEMDALLEGSRDILYSEDGLLLAARQNGAYDGLLPYSELLPYLRIGEAGRILQIARLTRACDGKTLKLRRGGLLAFKLDANPSSGYGWNFTADEGVTKVGSSFIMPKATDQRVGTPGVEIIFLAVKSGGTHVIEMSYKRPWERLVIDSFKLTVEVEE